MLAADSRGMVRDPSGVMAVSDRHVKLFQVSKYVGLVTYGHSDVAAKLREELGRRLNPGSGHIDLVLRRVRGVLRRCYQDWFSAVDVDQRPLVAFIVGGLGTDWRAKAYYLASSLDFAPQLSANPVALGGVVPYAAYLVHRVLTPEMTRQQLVRLAVYVISETATQDPRVGGPVRVAEITKEKGYMEVASTRIEAIVARNEVHNRKLREFFLREGE